LALYPISGVTGEGIDKLKYALAERVNAIRTKELTTTDKAEEVPRIFTDEPR
jgi:hypothetical protein